MLQRFLSEDFTFTKRHLGLVLLVAGVIVLVMMLAAEVFSSAPTGIGTMQKLGIGAGILSLTSGLTLLPLGDRPA
jgi:hypothetical protein